jgi:hypothetical protein
MSVSVRSAQESVRSLQNFQLVLSSRTGLLRRRELVLGTSQLCRIDKRVVELSVDHCVHQQKPRHWNSGSELGGRLSLR